MAGGRIVNLAASFPFQVISALVMGLALGSLFPHSQALKIVALSGNYFPRAVVTLAAFLIFNLLAAAMAKLVLVHSHRAGRLFGAIFAIYLGMGLLSLLYITLWIAALIDLPFTLPGVPVPGPLAWLQQVGHTLARALAEQPLLQALAGALLVGYLSARVPALRPVSVSLIRAGDAILAVFKGLQWYYPIMVGCLGLGIPLQFGSQGVAIYGETVLWIALASVSWSALCIVAAHFLTRRSWRQLLAYFAAVWPTGFGTGGSYNTLAVNIIAAERDLGLRREVAEISVVFGTVMNKNCSIMAVFLVTVTVARLLGIPIAMTEVLMLIPPVIILGLESPGIPGGAAFFMSPIIGALLQVPDLGTFVTTFVGVFSGLVPMFATAGNTTSDGIAGAFINDRCERYLGLARPGGAGEGRANA